MKMLSLSIDGSKALEALARVVKDAGEEYVDPAAVQGNMGCRYVRDGEPSCIVARVLSHLGVPVEVLRSMDASFNPQIGYDGKGVLHDYGVGLDAYATGALMAAQGIQDGGGSWGYALDKAREDVEARRRLAVTPK